MATEERVLCFERKLFEELGVFQGLARNREILAGGDFRFEDPVPEP